MPPLFGRTRVLSGTKQCLDRAWLAPREGRPCTGAVVSMNNASAVVASRTAALPPQSDLCTRTFAAGESAGTTPTPTDQTGLKRYFYRAIIAM